MTIEENVRAGGFGQQVRDALALRGLTSLPFAIFALPDEFVEHGAQPLIRRDCGLDAEHLVEAILKLTPALNKRFAVVEREIDRSPRQA